MNLSESVGFGAINLVCVYFTYNVDTSYAFRISSWSCCISATSSSVKYTIKNGDRPFASFTKADFFPIYGAVNYFFKIFFTRVGYSGTFA